MPRPDLKTLIRSAQVFFPWAVDAKAWTQRAVRRLFEQPFEEDFRWLASMPPANGRVFLDVGGNRGQSIDAIRMMQPHAIIHSFEPNAILAERLSEMFLGDPRVFVHAIGLGCEPADLTLHVPIYRGFAYDALASFDRASAADWLPGRIVGFRRDKLEVRALRCPVVTLDSLELDPCFIKLDVQGWEKHVLLGGLKTLRRARPTLLVETPEPSVVELLAAEGYSPHAFSHGRLRPGYGALNTFFLPGC